MRISETSMVEVHRCPAILLAWLRGTSECLDASGELARTEILELESPNLSLQVATGVRWCKPERRVNGNKGEAFALLLPAPGHGRLHHHEQATLLICAVAKAVSPP